MLVLKPDVQIQTYKNVQTMIWKQAEEILSFNLRRLANFLTCPKSTQDLQNQNPKEEAPSMSKKRFWPVSVTVSVSDTIALRKPKCPERHSPATNEAVLHFSKEGRN